MGSVLAVITTLLILLFAGAFALPHLVDWNQYRAVFAEEASKLVGRPVRVDGNVGLTLLPVPEISFERVAIADRSGSFKHPFARAKAFRMVLSLSPLLSGTLEAREITLDQPVVRLKIGADGRGNWSQIGSGVAELPFLPRQVTLRSVGIKDGGIILSDAAWDKPWRISHLNGKLSADSLSGPYKFHGNAEISGMRRHIDIGTGQQKPGGAIALKAKVRDRTGKGGKGAPAHYSVDGALSGFGGALHFDGALKAWLPLPAKLAEGKAHPNGDVLELSAQGAIGLERAQFKRITLNIVRQDRPQTITGNARADWAASRGLRLDGAFTSRWLDLDALAGAGAGTGAAELTPAQMVRMAPGLLASLPLKPHAANIRLTFPQISAGGELIRNLRAELAYAAGGWMLQSLAASLPGDSEFRFSGQIASAGAAIDLSGRLDAHGANLGRLLRWAAPQSFAGEIGAAHAFLLEGDLIAANERVSLREAQLHVDNDALTGSLDYAGGAKPRLTLKARGDRLDLRPFLPEMGARDLLLPLVRQHGRARSGGHKGKMDSGALQGWTARQQPVTPGLPSPPEAKNAPAPTAAPGNTLRARLHAPWRTGALALDLRLGRLLLSDGEAQDVIARLRATPQDTRIDRLAFAGEGWSVDAQGRVAGAAVHPHARLGLSLSADTEPGLRALIRLVRGGDAKLPDPLQARLGALAPLRLSASLDNRPGTGVTTLRLDGMAAASRIGGTARIESDFAGLLSAPAQISAHMRNPSASALFAQIAPALASAADARARARFPAGEGQLRLDATGVLNARLAGSLALSTAPLDARITGTLAYDGADHGERGVGVRVTGDLKAQARDVATALRLLGLDWPQNGAADDGVSLTAQIAATARDLTLEDARLAIGGTAAQRTALAAPEAAFKPSLSQPATGGAMLTTGTASLHWPEPGRAALPHLTISAKAQQANLPALLAFLVNRRAPSIAASNGTAPSPSATGDTLTGATFWADRPFALDRLAHLSANLSLSATRMHLAGSMMLDKAALRARLDQGALALDQLSGRLWGGNFTAQATLAPKTGFATLSGELRLARPDLALLPHGDGGGQPLASGDGDIQIGFSGSGVSPRGLISGLAGEGRIRLGEGTIRGLGTARVLHAAQAMLDAKTQPAAGSLERSVGEALRRGAFAHRKAVARLRLDNGVLRLRKAQLRPRHGGGAIGVNASVNLADLTLASRWRLSPQTRGQLPPVQVVLSGPLADFGRIAPVIDASDLERALAVRRLERGVERLERFDQTPPDAGANARQAHLPVAPPPPVAPSPAPPPSAAPAAPLPDGWAAKSVAAPPGSAATAPRQNSFTPPQDAPIAPSGSRRSEADAAIDALQAPDTNTFEARIRGALDRTSADQAPLTAVPESPVDPVQPPLPELPSPSPARAEKQLLDKARAAERSQRQAQPRSLFFQIFGQ